MTLKSHFSGSFSFWQTVTSLRHLREAVLTSPATSYSVSRGPGFWRIHNALADPYAYLKGLQNSWSSSWSLWVVCRGVLSMLMWLSRAYSITFRYLWLPCPSNTKRTGRAAEECTCCWKCCSHWRNFSAFVQPLSQATPMLSGGTPIIRRPFLFIFPWGKEHWWYKLTMTSGIHRKHHSDVTTSFCWCEFSNLFFFLSLTIPYHFYRQLRPLFHRHYLFEKLGIRTALGVLRGHKPDRLEVHWTL